MTLNKVLDRLIWLSIGLQIIPFIVINLYNHPSADDFCIGADTRKLGFWFFQYHNYLNWQGRYFSTFIRSLLGTFDSYLYIYKYLSLGMLVLFVVSIMLYFSKVVLKESFEKKSQFMISSVLALAILNNLPFTPSGLYWMSAYVTYTLPSALILLLIVIIYSRVYETSTIYKVLLYILSIAIIGSNEIIMIYLNMFVFYIYATSKKRSDLKLFKYLLITCLIASIFVIIAPGNLVRSEYFPYRHAWNSIFFSIGYGAYKGLYWIILNPVILILSYLAIKASSNVNKIHINKWLLILGWLIAGIGFFVPFWSIGNPGALRVSNLIYFVFFIYWTRIVTKVNCSKSNKMFLTTKIKVVLLIFIFLNFFYSNSFAMYKDLKYRSKVYDEELKARYKLYFEKSETTEVVKVPKLTNVPRSIFFYDITDDPNGRMNKCVAAYFGLKSVKTFEK